MLTLRSVTNLGTGGICVFLSKDSEHPTERRKVQFRDFLIKLFWQELEIVLVGIGPRQIPQQIKPRLHLEREGTQSRIHSRHEANTITR